MLNKTMKSGDWKIGLVENEEKYREQIITALRSMPSVGEVLPWNSAEEFWKDDRGFDLDMVLLDINLVHMNGVELAHMLNERNPDLRIVMLTVVASDEIIFRALQAGAVGYLLKSELRNLPEITEKIMAGGAVMTPTIAFRVMRAFRHEAGDVESPDLTRRERQVLEQMTAGLSIKHAAERLGISENTAHFHVKNIYKKLNVRNRVQMMQRASDLGLVQKSLPEFSE